MSFEVRKAKRSRRPLKINLEGLSGSGKTYTALRLAFAMLRAGIGTRLVVADSENESAGLYDGIVSDGQKWEYETCPIPPDRQNPAGYTAAYRYLVGEGYDLIVMDSLSHAWHGAMEQVDAYAKKNRGDKFGAWADVTPAQREMLATLTDGRAHLIATMRVKSEYERYEKANGKEGIRKIGTKTDQREGAEYEFDVVARLDISHEIVVEKVRGCTSMDGKTGVKPGPEFWQPLFAWWLSADPVVSEDERLSARLLACATAADLADAWLKLSKPQQERLLAVKDARKAELTASASPPPPVEPTSPPPAEPAPEPAPREPGDLSPDDEGDLLSDQFLRLAESIGVKPANLIDLSWKDAKLPHRRPLPKSTGELKLDELRKLVPAAEAYVARTKPATAAS